MTRAVTELAEFALDVACVQAQRELDAQFGAPTTPDGQRAELWVVGMGKLGARELNVSSDIDLIYIYDQDGETAGVEGGRGRISNHEYFDKAVKTIYGLIGDTTEHGFVFRVDLALRPNGNSGPLAVSLDALEDYFQVQGREWERFAWLKSRVVAPSELRRRAVRPRPCAARCCPSCSAATSITACSTRCACCTGRFASTRRKRSAGRPERANDVKLSRGGIREIEFTVQLLQVVRGGQFPELRTRPTLQALQRLAAAGLMPQATADAMARAYEFLRRVEHRIQYLDDQQTHVLPTGANTAAMRPDLDRPHHGLCRLLPLPARTGHAPRAGGPGIRHACWAAPAAATARPATAPRAPRPRRRTWRRCWSNCRRSCANASRYGVRHPRVMALRDDARARLVRLLARTAQWLERGRGDRRGRRAHGRLDRAAAAPRKLPGLAGRAARRCTSGCCACWAPRAGRRATCCSTPA